MYGDGKKYSNQKPKDFAELVFDFTDYNEPQNLINMKMIEDNSSNGVLVYIILSVFILGFIGICINMFCVETAEQRRERQDKELAQQRI